MKTFNKPDDLRYIPFTVPTDWYIESISEDPDEGNGVEITSMHYHFQNDESMLVLVGIFGDVHSLKVDLKPQPIFDKYQFRN